MTFSHGVSTVMKFSLVFVRSLGLSVGNGLRTKCARKLHVNGTQQLVPNCRAYIPTRNWEKISWEQRIRVALQTIRCSLYSYKRVASSKLEPQVHFDLSIEF